LIGSDEYTFRGTTTCFQLENCITCDWEKEIGVGGGIGMIDPVDGVEEAPVTEDDDIIFGENACDPHYVPFPPVAYENPCE